MTPASGTRVAPDARPVTLRYDASCASCGRGLDAGRPARWSPGAKKNWCARPCAERSALPPPTEGEEDAQVRWERLVSYARLCVEAEAAASLPRAAAEGTTWFAHSGAPLAAFSPAGAPAPRALLERIAQRGPPEAMSHGWPLAIVPGERALAAAPLFVALCDLVDEDGGGARLLARSKPEPNLGACAALGLDGHTINELAAIAESGLLSSNAAAAVRAAAALTGLPELAVPAPGTPIGAEGLVACAITVLEAATTHHAGLIEELDRLRDRADWRDTAAAALVSGVPPAGRAPEMAVAAPLAANLAQSEALDRLLTERLSVVTGPPGTGKTQVIVNAAANAWLRGESMLVASTNNAAVDVPVRRAAEILPGLLMPTGNRAKRDALTDWFDAAVLWAREEEPAPGGESAAREALERAADDRTRLVRLVARQAQLDETLRTTATERPTQVVEAERLEAALWAGSEPPERVDAASAARAAMRLERGGPLAGWRRGRLRRRLGVSDATPLSDIVRWGQARAKAQALDATERAAREERIAVRDAIGSAAEADLRTARALEEASTAALRERAVAALRRGARRLPGGSDAAPGATREVIERARSVIPAWACTALSARANFPLRAGAFDLVVIDEANQCTLPAVLPLAYRARRLGVIGDPQQLAPVVRAGPAALAAAASTAGLDAATLEQRRIAGEQASAYAAFAAALPDGHDPVLLRLHYRCHPRIAGWFTQAFYDDRLIPVGVGAEPAASALSWTDVDGQATRAGRSSWENPAEANAAARRAAEIMREHPDWSVGAVAPFAAQARLLGQLVRRLAGPEACERASFASATAHRYQGNERDAMILTCVVAPGIGRRSTQWIEEHRNLVNVAASRARHRLVAFGHPRLASAGAATFASLREYVIATESGMPRSSRVDSEAERMLREALRARGLEPAAKITVVGYELDFALAAGSGRVNVEVDGRLHEGAGGEQRFADLARDRMLSERGWTVLRIPAWRCRAQPDACADEVAWVCAQLRDRTTTGP